MPKKYILSTIIDSANFHYFCKVRAYQITVKNSIFQKLPKIVENNFFWWLEEIFLPNDIFLAKFKIVQNFHYFCKSRACRITVKNSIFQKLPKIVEKQFFWWLEEIILSINIFLAKFKIVQNFHYFCKVWPVELPSKIQFSKNCLKLWRTTSFDDWKKNFYQMIFS